jgi:lipoprotein Spr
MLNKLQTLSIFLVLIITYNTSAQSVASEKKGTNTYTEKTSKTVSAKSKTAERALTVTESDLASLLGGSTPVIAYEPVKEIRKGGPSQLDAPVKKKRLSILNESETDFAPYTENYLAEQIVNNAVEEFEGVRYRGGGTTKAGMDCSGMVTAAYRIFDISLPRSSHEMAKAGTEVGLTEVKKGDLLFFKNNPRKSNINHVGIVTEVTEEGEVKFLHSSSSNGVIVSSMNEAYHKRTFVQACRIIEN